MIIIEREDRQGTLASRGRVIASHIDGAHVVSATEAASKFRAYQASGELLYFIDNLRAAATYMMTCPRAPFVVDIGDDVASLFATQGRHAMAVAAAWMMQTAVLRRANALVCRGLGQAGAVRAYGSRRVIVMTDFASVPVHDVRPNWRPGAPVIGFIGSSYGTSKAPGAGWEIPPLLRLLGRDSQAVVVAKGSGVPAILRRAKELGVDGQLDLYEGILPSELVRCFAPVNIAISSQTFNRAGEVRTTGKLADYLAMGKVVVASRVGTAAALLPADCTVAPVSALFSEAYVHALYERVRAVSSVDELKWKTMGLFSHALATQVFAAAPQVERLTEALHSWNLIRAGQYRIGVVG